MTRAGEPGFELRGSRRTLRNGVVPPDTGEPDPRRWRALSVCLVAGFMSLLDVSIVNVAIPTMAKDFGASTDDIQWVATAYSLALGVMLTVLAWPWFGPHLQGAFFDPVFVGLLAAAGSVALLATSFLLRLLNRGGSGA